MAKVFELLKSVNAYPIPLRAITEAADKRSLNLDKEANSEDIQGREYRLVKADLFMWLSFAPDVSQGGQSFSFTDEQRKSLRNQAKAIYAELEPDGDKSQKTIYGYKGSRL